MVPARIDLARTRQRDDEDEPLVNVLLALSASTAAVMGLLDAMAGRLPLTLLPCLAVVAGHLLRLHRPAVLASALVWVRVGQLSDASGLVTPLAMLLICAVVLIGPGRVFDWLESCWEASDDRRWLEGRARPAARPRTEVFEAVGWIEDLPEPR